MNKKKNPHHSHFGEVNESLLCEVGRPLLDERQVSEVHAQVGNTWRIAAVFKDTQQQLENNRSV